MQWQKASQKKNNKIIVNKCVSFETKYILHISPAVKTIKYPVTERKNKNKNKRT